MIGVLRWGWVEVIIRVSLEVILHHLLRQLVPRGGGCQGPCQELSEVVLVVW